MGRLIDLIAADGAKLTAYEATAAHPRAGIVLLQEIFGVNDHIRRVCDTFAGHGFKVLAPALFDRIEPGVELGYGPDDIPRGRELRAQVTDDAALADVKAAVDVLAAEGPVFVVGYCWGGYVAWLAATQLEGLAGAVSYYGGGIGGKANATPKTPVQMHFGEQDHAIPMSEVEAVRAAHPDLPIFTYPAGHGFGCEARPSYAPDSARLADERTLAFIGGILASR